MICNNLLARSTSGNQNSYNLSIPKLTQFIDYNYQATTRRRVSVEQIFVMKEKHFMLSH